MRSLLRCAVAPEALVPDDARLHALHALRQEEGCPRCTRHRGSLFIPGIRSDEADSVGNTGKTMQTALPLFDRASSVS